MATASSDAEAVVPQLSRLRKVELHAHLNGCIREATLLELARERGVVLSSTVLHAPVSDGAAGAPSAPRDRRRSTGAHRSDRPRSLTECFQVFREIARAVNDLPALERIAREALRDHDAWGVAYLELRTTPKRLLVDSRRDRRTASKRDYAETVLRVMRECAADPAFRVTCRLILAVDRSLPLAEARETLALAVQLRAAHPGLVVGVDLGGNPLCGDFRDFRDLLQETREAGLKVTLHCAETPCDEGTDAYAEAAAMLDFRPDRLGHAILLPPPLQQRLRDLRIPVETCPTSNVMTLELHKPADGDLVHGLRQHALLRDWVAQGHPLTIGTDDPGVFHTDPTRELLLLLQCLGLTVAQLAEILLRSVDYAFCEEATKDRIRMEMINAAEEASDRIDCKV